MRYLTKADGFNRRPESASDDPATAVDTYPAYPEDGTDCRENVGVPFCAVCFHQDHTADYGVAARALHSKTSFVD